MYSEVLGPCKHFAAEHTHMLNAQMFGVDVFGQILFRLGDIITLIAWIHHALVFGAAVFFQLKLFLGHIFTLIAGKCVLSRVAVIVFHAY